MDIEKVDKSLFKQFRHFNSWILRFVDSKVVLTQFRRGEEQKVRPTSFSSVTSANVEIIP